MRCAICDKDAEEVTAFNTDCSECQEVIYETLASYDVEEEFTGDPEFVELSEAEIFGAGDDVGC